MVKHRNLNHIVTTHYLGNQINSEGKLKPELRSVGLRNPKTRVDHPCPIEVHFDHIEEVIIENIRNSDVAVGAVAWLSSPRILSALSKLYRSAIIVQKEDYLRLDAGDARRKSWKKQRRDLYSALQPFKSEDFPESYPGIWDDHPDHNGTIQHRLFDASGMYQFDGDAVRCLGYYGSKGELLPRMHHKFLVLGAACYSQVMSPRLVITGSFNMTNNATTSRENVVVIFDKQICQAYISEWAQLWSVAEPLDWESPEPEIIRTNMGT